MDQVSPALEWPMGVVYLCIPLGGALMLVETAGLLYRAVRGLPPPRAPLEEAVE
jgi:TRAP-type C4-dicarboxylate transport system permease small subunit